MCPYEGHEEVVNDRLDAFGLRWFEVHEHVVAHQVERHGEHGWGNAFEIDLASSMCALVDGPPVREQLVTHDLRVELRGGHPDAGQQPRERGTRGDGEEAGTGLAQGRQLCEQVAAQGAGVRHGDRVSVPIVIEHGEHELILVRPTAIQHGLARVGTRGNGTHCQTGVPGFDQLVPSGSEDRGLELLAVPATPRRTGHLGDHHPTIERLAFLRNPS
jgi:hypothetical protein